MAVAVREAIALRERWGHDNQLVLVKVQPCQVLSRISVRFRGREFPSVKDEEI